MRKSLLAVAFLLVSLGVAPMTGSRRAQAPQQPPPQQPTPPAAPAPVPPQAPAGQPAPLTPLQPTIAAVILDPAHGGADAGARGASGAIEAEAVLGFASAVRAALEAQGFRVFQTRQGNENPSFDDRSALANAHRGDVFISLHVSSTGPLGTVRAYSLPVSTVELNLPLSPPPARPGLPSWDHAQDPYLGLSRRLAELVQVQLAQKFHGSPEVPFNAAVRQLRNVAAPAIAVEVCSVAVPNRSQLDQMAPALAEAVARAVAGFRTIYEAGAK